jgi:hypothetical protein
MKVEKKTSLNRRDKLPFKPKYERLSPSQALWPEGSGTNEAAAWLSVRQHQGRTPCLVGIRGFTKYGAYGICNMLNISQSAGSKHILITSTGHEA